MNLHVYIFTAYDKSLGMCINMEGLLNDIFAKIKRRDMIATQTTSNKISNDTETYNFRSPYDFQ